MLRKVIVISLCAIALLPGCSERQSEHSLSGVDETPSQSKSPAQASASPEISLPSQLATIVKITNCSQSSYSGRVTCIFKNMTDMPVNMHDFHAIGYDINGVKLGEGNTTETIEPNGSTAIDLSFTANGSSDPRRIVLTSRLE